MSKNILVVGFAVLFSYIFASNCNAEIMSGSYEKLKGTEELQIYISGVGSGLESANVYLIINNRAELYCVPNKLSLSANNYLDILDKSMNENRGKLEKQECPLKLVLLFGLVKTFPCEKNAITKRKKK